MPQPDYNSLTKTIPVSQELQKFRSYLSLTKKLWEMPKDKIINYLQLAQDTLVKFNSDNIAIQTEALKTSKSLLALPSIQIDNLINNGELQNILESYINATQGLANNPALDFNQFATKETNKYITKMNLKANMIDFHIKVS